MFTNVNDAILFYERSGSGLPLLLLHGNGEDHTIFSPLAAKLGRHFTVFALDGRNHGQSSKTDVFTYEAMAEDLRQFILAEGLERPHILGFSDGAIIALMTAINNPGLLGDLALLGVNLKPSDFLEENIRYLHDHYEATGDPLYKMMLEQPDISLDDVRRVTNKTLLLAGENDLYKPEMYETLMGALPHATLEILPGHTHDSYIVGQDLLYPRLKDFFGQKPAGGAQCSPHSRQYGNL